MNTDVIKQFDWKHAATLCVIFLLVTVFGLWAWNTISELYNGPAAQYKHVVAALLLLAILRWPLQRAGRQRLVSPGV
jgi:hypothetical protein